MSVKKESVASLKRQIAELDKQVIDIASKLKQASDMKGHYYKSQQEYQAEINAVHDLLDVLPNTIARRKDGEYSPEHKLMTRLASFLANRVTV
jgi:chromosome segregation ATPase